MTVDTRVETSDVARAEQMFERWIGFDIQGAAPRRLEDFLVVRARYLGYDSVAGYLADLPRDRPTTTEAQRLVNVLTNGLTAFWRDHKQIEALLALLEQLHARYERTLNVWCAGCATGEEAYTVAIAAAECDVPVQVLGTEVNTRFLDNARRAEFDDWSLRRMGDGRRARWFEERGDRWALDNEITTRVEFRYHNLLDPPPVAASGGPWDAILCRNVMIYLTDEATSRILMNFAKSIARDGYLLLGSSEQIVDPLAPFRATRKGPAFVFRAVSIDPGESLQFPAVDDPPTLDVVSLDDEETAGFEEDAAISKLLRAGVDHDDADSAVACFEAAAGYDPFTTEIYALLAVTLQEAGADRRAIDALGKVLFLDPDNWWAAGRRAMLYERQGDRVEAHRHWRIVLDCIERRPGNPFEHSLALGALEGLQREREAMASSASKALDRLHARS